MTSKREKGHDVVEVLARSGYAARGVVYVIVGFFAILASFGEGSNKDTKGALEELLGQPFGEALVWIMVVGLFGYVVWRLTQAILDTDDHGTSPKGLVVRGSLIASATSYGALGLFSLSMLGVLPGSSDSGSGSMADTMAGFVGGHAVSAILSVTFAIVAGAHWWKAYKRKYADHFDADEDKMPLIHAISRVGLTARGLVFAIISFILGYRFFASEPTTGSAPGVKDALTFVHDLPAGDLLLGLMGMGIMTFAAYSMIAARYRKVHVRALTASRSQG